MMMGPFATQPENTGNGGGFVVIMLALYLIILAFFILLNSLSSPAQDKQSAAIYGIQEGFDHRMQGDALGDDMTTDVGPSWVPPVESKVRGLVQQAWPGAEVTMSAEAGVIEVTLGLADVWQEGVFIDSFVALVQNVNMTLQEAPDAGLRLLIASTPREDVVTMFAALEEQLAGMNAGWVQAEQKDGTLVEQVKLIITQAQTVPADVAGQAADLIRRAGGTTETRKHE